MTEGNNIIDLDTLETEELIRLKYEIEALLEERRVAVVEWETLENKGQFVSLTRYLDPRTKIVFTITEERDILWQRYSKDIILAPNCGFITCLEDMKNLVGYSSGTEHYYEKLRLATLEMFG